MRWIAPTTDPEVPGFRIPFEVLLGNTGRYTERLLPDERCHTMFCQRQGDAMLDGASSESDACARAKQGNVGAITCNLGPGLSILQSLPDIAMGELKAT